MKLQLGELAWRPEEMPYHDGAPSALLSHGDSESTGRIAEGVSAEWFAQLAARRGVMLDKLELDIAELIVQRFMARLNTA